MTFRPTAALWLPALAGIVSVLSYQKINHGYLAWIATIPLVLFVFCRSQTVSRAFWGGLLMGTVQFFILLAWIPRVLYQHAGIGAPLAWTLYSLLAVAQACFPAVVCGYTRLVINRMGEKFVLVFPVAWVAMEYARNYFFLCGFPWLQTGYTQTDYLILIQISDLAGVYGVSFLVLWINTAIAWGWIGRLREWKFRWPLIAGGVLVIFALSYGKSALGRWQRIQPEFRAALLQGNLSDDEPEYIQVWKFQHGYINMAKALKTSVDLLVLPESPSPLTFQYDAAYREALQRLASGFSLGIIFNNIRFAGSSGNQTEYFNSAYVLSQEGKETGRYDKIHLVPFGEYVPWKNLFSFIETISKDVGGFSPGTSYDVVHLKNHPANIIICFEAIFPELVREFVRRGSTLIVNLTNDRWYGDTAAPYQHLAITRWRAVENRRYLLRATNSGISAIIEPTGRIQTRTKLLSQDLCVGNFAFISEQSFYTRRGDVFAGLCAIITSLFLARSVWRGRLGLTTYRDKSGGPDA
jgi:apolipoprotein N-acyltransferase